MEKTLNNNKQEVIIASACHISAAIPFFGMMIPVILWITQKNKSDFICFHAIQSLIYQCFGIFMFFIGMIFYFISFFIFFIGSIITALINGNGDPDPSFFILFFIPIVILFLIMLFFFLYMLYAFLASITLIIKKDFKYIIIGKFLEKYLLENNSMEIDKNKSSD